MFPTRFRYIPLTELLPPLPVHASDRFNLLVDRMRVLRKRHGAERKKAEPAHVKKLLTLLCLTALVERGEAAEVVDRE